jgi:hypothetical protein
MTNVLIVEDGVLADPYLLREEVSGHCGGRRASALALMTGARTSCCST